MRSTLSLLPRIAFLSALASAWPAGAADTFLVELLAFENTGETATGEHFPAGERAPPEVPVPPAVRYTGAGLPAQAAILGKNPAYRVLLSSGWQQALSDRASSPPVPVSPPAWARPVAEFGGSLRLYEASSLLYLETDLGFSPAGEASAYRIREKRRVKLNEVHYFDHPRFGVLVRVSRVPQG